MRKGSLCAHLFLTSADYCTVLLLITKARVVTCCIVIGDWIEIVSQSLYVHFSRWVARNSNVNLER